jgi:hypothetical protein
MKSEPFGRTELAQDVEIVLPGMGHRLAAAWSATTLMLLRSSSGEDPLANSPTAGSAPAKTIANTVWKSRDTTDKFSQLFESPVNA